MTIVTLRCAACGHTFHRVMSDPAGPCPPCPLCGGATAVAEPVAAGAEVEVPARERASECADGT